MTTYTIVFYIFTFLAIYAQVFFLITFLENRKKIVIRKGEISLSRYPEVTLIVPCWNEEGTIERTVGSIFGLRYPKDKLHIILVDDGSTDGTWQALRKFEGHGNVRVFHKENGGKHTALNVGLANTHTEFLGCLDADSFADPEALVRIMSYFERDPAAMAVAPSIIVSDPRGIVQRAQKAEYNMAVFTKKMLGFLGAIHVTPGPLTIFRKKVFDDLGPYRSAHNTEDMEIAYRMQKHRYKIDQCNDAYVYTNAPKTVRKLYKQRLRWIYGFINNTIDYRHILFQKKYGNFSTFTVPAGIVSIFAVSYLFGRLLYNVAAFIGKKILLYKTVGFHFAPHFHSFDAFFINTQSLIFVTLFLYALVISAIVIGHRMATGKWGFSMNMVYYFSIFSLVAPLWLFEAVCVTLLSKKPSWR